MILQQQTEASIQIQTLYLNKEGYVHRRSPKNTFKLRPMYAPYTLRVKATTGREQRRSSSDPLNTCTLDTHLRHRTVSNIPRSYIGTREYATRSTAYPSQQSPLRSHVDSEAETTPEQPERHSYSTPPDGSWRQLRPAEQQTPEVVSGASDDVNDPRTPSAGYVGSRAKYYFSRDERNTPKIYIEYYGRRARGPMHPSNVSHSHPHSLSRATRGQSEISYGSRPSSRDSSSRAFESDGSPCFTAASSFRSSTAQTFESSPGPQYGSLSRTYDSEPAHIVDPVPRETNAQAGPSKLPVGTPSPPEPEVNRNPPVESNWRDYTSVNPQTQQYMCLWKNVNDQGVESTCGYRAKKHLVKRHIESVHLHIKLLACPEPGCEKSFSQQTNLNTHINTHTKESPHKCLYKGCNLSFGDPARRHRHMKKKHNHVPSRRRTQGDRDDEWTPEGTIPPPEIPLGDVNAGSREHPNEES